MGTGAVVSFAVPVLRFASTVSNRRDQSEGHRGRAAPHRGCRPPPSRSELERGKRRSRSGGASQGDVSMLAPRIFQLLVLEHLQRAADALARLMRLDHIVDEA